MLQGFLRVAAASPLVRVGDPDFHLAQHRDLLRQAEQAGVHVERGDMTLEQMLRTAIYSIPHHISFLAENRKAPEL